MMPYFDPNQFGFSNFYINPTHIDDTQLLQCAGESAQTLDSFPISYVKQICNAVEKRKDLSLMTRFLTQIFLTRHCAESCVLKLKAVQLFEQQSFKDLYILLETTPFPREFHADLQSLWNEAHYRETERTRSQGKPLDPVTRYRVRKKHSFPKTIWDGEQTMYHFKKRDRITLRDAYKLNPMPSQAEKQELSNQTNLSVTQVSNWFKNQRQRQRQQRKLPKEGMDIFSDTDSNRSNNSCSKESNGLPELDENRLNASNGTSLIQPTTSFNQALQDFQQPFYSNYTNTFNNWNNMTTTSLNASQSILDLAGVIFDVCTVQKK
uniref:Homeobox domain-containing protein n=1 Tax=Bursaphelenchus xylophilus TaxID=6326 RepID=A0A1I7RXB5_BURXY